MHAWASPLALSLHTRSKYRHWCMPIDDERPTDEQYGKGAGGHVQVIYGGTSPAREIAGRTRTGTGAREGGVRDQQGTAVRIYALYTDKIHTPLRGALLVWRGSHSVVTTDNRSTAQPGDFQRCSDTQRWWHLHVGTSSDPHDGGWIDARGPFQWPVGRFAR